MFSLYHRNLHGLGEAVYTGHNRNEVPLHNTVHITQYTSHEMVSMYYWNLHDLGEAAYARHSKHTRYPCATP
jgi:hypothetical protein